MMGGVPVIDPTLAPVKYAEYMVELRQRLDWRTSKVGLYESPPSEEILGWKLPEQYPNMKCCW